MLPANFDHVYATGETLTLPVGSLHVQGFKIDENASTLDFDNGSVYTYAQVLTQGYTDIDQAYQEFNSVTVPDGGDYADSTALFTTVLVPPGGQCHRELHRGRHEHTAGHHADQRLRLHR